MTGRGADRRAAAGAEDFGCRRSAVTGDRVGGARRLAIGRGEAGQFGVGGGQVLPVRLHDVSRRTGNELRILEHCPHPLRFGLGRAARSGQARAFAVVDVVNGLAPAAERAELSFDLCKTHRPHPQAG